MKQILTPIVVLLVFLAVSPKTICADSGPDVATRLDKLMIQAEVLEKKYEEILEHQDKTIEQIKNLKIVVRRR